ncbi:zinc finger protein 346-like [Sinocyclocheilus grahami]|uniref:zinc finger protein 346-like n=1 Tax=Sinocyclocheilus grahami TaxID=75366 RepID=UPI0007AD28CD|nr:PREDICTED: zinc finger protein 346-like [Sinocyclocheilus grahami]
MQDKWFTYLFVNRFKKMVTGNTVGMKRLAQRMYRLRMRDPPPANMAQQEPNGDFPYLPSGAAEVNRMIKEHSDLFSDSQCKVCSAVLISESQKLAHYQSNLFCSICQSSFNNPLMAQQHYSGKKHKKHLTKQKLMETYGPSSAPDVQQTPQHRKSRSPPEKSLALG